MRIDPYADTPRLPAEPVALDLDTVVPGSGPIVLEIGSGRGAFTLEYAGAHPEHRILALEIRRKYAAVLARRIAERGLASARCYCEDARLVLPRFQPPGGIAAVAIHFPDPWWKKRHAKRLVVGDALLDELARLVAPGGIVFVQTDVAARADEYAARFAAHPAFASAGPNFQPESPFAPARSNRERRAMRDGLPVFRMIFRRSAREVLNARNAT